MTFYAIIEKSSEEFLRADGTRVYSLAEATWFPTQEAANHCLVAIASGQDGTFLVTTIEASEAGAAAKLAREEVLGPKASRLEGHATVSMKKLARFAGLFEGQEAPRPESQASAERMRDKILYGLYSVQGGNGLGSYTKAFGELCMEIARLRSALETARDVLLHLTRRVEELEAHFDTTEAGSKSSRPPPRAEEPLR